MPKFLDNYRLQLIQNINIDGMEHYTAKQNGSNKKFILKRFKIDTPHNQSTNQNRILHSQTQQLFDKLTNQTLILKIFQHSSIPKCIRMLKTSNSIYFVFQNYSLTPLQQYLRKSWLKLEQKIQLSVQILQTLYYIQQKNVIYRGMDLNNIKIDHTGHVYLTNFKNARQFQNSRINEKSLDSAKKQRQFKSLLLEDIFDVGKTLFQIFQFDKIDPLYYSFGNDIEKKAYQLLSQILQRSITPKDIETLLKIFNEKQSIRTTACTETSQSPRSPSLNRLKLKKAHSRNITLNEEDYKAFRSSSSNTKLTLRSSLNRDSLLNSVRVMSSSSISKVTSISKVSTPRRLNSSINNSTSLLTLTKQKQHSILEGQIVALITNRKTINFLFHCIKFVAKCENNKLVMMLLLKCQQLSQNIQKSLKQFPIHLTEKHNQLLKISKNQNIKTLSIVSQLKQSLLLVVNYDEIERKIFIEQLMKKKTLQQIDQMLSIEIYNFLQKQLSSHSKGKPRPELDLCSSKQTSFSALSASLSTLRLKENSSFASKINLGNPQQFYEKFKFSYYLSIKLKYSTFENFFQKRNNWQAVQFDVLKDEYFQPFESQSIPVNQLGEEIMFRIEKFGKRSKPIPMY